MNLGLRMLLDSGGNVEHTVFLSLKDYIFNEHRYLCMTKHLYPKTRVFLCLKGAQDKPLSACMELNIIFCCVLRTARTFSLE